MISNERPSPYSPWQKRTPSYAVPKPRVQETTLKSERLQVERKTFTIVLKENDRGRFLRITEEANGHRDMIIVPSTGLEEFSKTLSVLVSAASAPPTSSRAQ